MIKCHLSKLLGERRLKITDVARDTNINRGTITRIFHETASRIDLKIINSLCEYLDCRIEDLLEYQKDDANTEEN